MRNMKYKYLKLLSFLPAIFLMVMIFYFSNAQAHQSTVTSTQVSRVIVRGVAKIMNKELDGLRVEYYAIMIEGVVRKIAHMAEYAMLAVAVAFPLYVYGVRGFRLTVISFLICVLYAASDEFHQTFVLGRSGQLRDVVIDSIGIMAGIIFTRIVGWTGRMTLRLPLK